MSAWNVLWLTADDLDASLPGFMGGHPEITPHLDELAARSHRFVRNRTVVPICQPARQAMMTGLLPHRSGATGFTPIRPGIPTLTSILREAGYLTAGIHKLEHMLPAESFPWELAFPGKDRNPDAYEAAVVAALEQAQSQGRPFYINCNLNDPHRPFYGSPAADEMDAGQSGPYQVDRVFSPREVSIPPILEDLDPIRRELSQYWSSIRRMDFTIGKVLAALRRAGRENDTVVIFCSDHGMPFPFAKATCYDNGTRVPVLISWPTMPPPRAYTQLTSNIDLLPTILDLLGLASPPDIDGRSWAPLIEQPDRPGRDYVFTYVNTLSSGGSFPMRAVHDQRFVLIATLWAGGDRRFKAESMRGLTFASLRKAGRQRPDIDARVQQYLEGVPLALYDLERDPAQRVNLIGEAEHKHQASKMFQVLLDEMRRTGDPEAPKVERLAGLLDASSLAGADRPAAHSFG